MSEPSVPSYSRLAWEMAKACAGFGGTLDGQVEASVGLSTGQVLKGVGSTINEALQRLAVALDEVEFAQATTYHRLAREFILGDDEAEALTVFPHDDPESATPLFGLNLSVGWADKIVASGAFEHDAKGIACALAAAFGCPAYDQDGNPLR